MAFLRDFSIANALSLSLSHRFEPSSLVMSDYKSTLLSLLSTTLFVALQSRLRFARLLVRQTRR